MEGYCEEDFNKNILDIVNMSEILHDNFKIHEKNGKFYLSKREKMFIKKKDVTSNENLIKLSEDNVIEELFQDPENVEHDKSATTSEPLDAISIEYHVLFHPSYQVPALYFIAHTGNIN